MPAPPPYMHPDRREITVVDDTPVPYASLPMAGDPVFDDNLIKRYSGATLNSYVFRRVLVNVDALYRQSNDLETLPFYERLVAEQKPGAAERLAVVKAHIATLRGGGDVTPIVISVDWAWTQVLDGYHRIAAADAAGVARLEAFERIHVPPNVLRDPSVSNRPLKPYRVPSAAPSG
jgi:hypothetical protein